MDNTIFNDMDETIGYYSDLVSGYKKLIKEAVQDEDFEQAKDLMEQLEEINNWTDNDGLLVLSMNNGMGFTCRPYQPKQSKGERV
jgi:hypothetical protein